MHQTILWIRHENQRILLLVFLCWIQCKWSILRVFHLIQSLLTTATALAMAFSQSHLQSWRRSDIINLFIYSMHWINLCLKCKKALIKLSHRSGKFQRHSKGITDSRCRTIKKLQTTIVRFHEELQPFLSQTAYIMRMLMNYVNSDWKVRMSMTTEAAVTESNNSKQRLMRSRWQWRESTAFKRWSVTFS